MPVLHRGGREERIAEGEAASRKREAREQAEVQAAERATARLEAEVEKEMLAELEAREREAAMSDAERTERRLRMVEMERVNGVEAVLVKHPARPRGWALAREAVQARWRREAEQEREKRERKDGTLKRRQEWEQDQAAIAAKFDADLRAERERHETTSQRIREGAEDARQKLGDRP